MVYPKGRHNSLCVCNSCRKSEGIEIKETKSNPGNWVTSIYSRLDILETDMKWVKKLQWVIISGLIAILLKLFL